MNAAQKPAISPWQQRMAADKEEIRKTAREAILRNGRAGRCDLLSEITEKYAGCGRSSTRC